MNPYNRPMNIGAFELTFERSKREEATNCFCRPTSASPHLGIKIKIYNEEDKYKISFLKSRDGVSSRPSTEDQKDRDVASLEALKTDIQNVRPGEIPSATPEPVMWMDVDEPDEHETTPGTGR